MASITKALLKKGPQKPGLGESSGKEYKPRLVSRNVMEEVQLFDSAGQPNLNFFELFKPTAVSKLAELIALMECKALRVGEHNGKPVEQQLEALLADVAHPDAHEAIENIVQGAVTLMAYQLQPLQPAHRK